MAVNRSACTLADLIVNPKTLLPQQVVTLPRRIEFEEASDSMVDTVKRKHLVIFLGLVLELLALGGEAIRRSSSSIGRIMRT